MFRSIFRAQGNGVKLSGKFRLDIGKKALPPGGGQALEHAPQGSGCGTKSARAPGMCGWCSWTRGVMSDIPAKCRVGHDVSLPTWGLSLILMCPQDFYWWLFWSLNWAADTRKSINVQWKNCVEIVYLMVIKDFTYRIFTWCKEICMWQVLWSVEISKSAQWRGFILISSHHSWMMQSCYEDGPSLSL